MNLETMLEIFEEMPGRVQTALLSHAFIMKRRGRNSQDYPRVVAEYIKASGFYDVEIRPAVHEDRKEYVWSIVRKNDTSLIFHENTRLFHRIADHAK